MTKLSVGTHIKAFILLNSEGNRIAFLPAILKAHIDNNRLLIIIPIRYIMSYPIDINDKIIIECSDKNITFDATILQINYLGALSYFLLEQDCDYCRIQDRQDFRLNCMLEGYIQHTGSKCGGVKRFNIETRDISGGGVCIYSPISLNVGESINVYLPLGYNNEYIFYPSNVKRCIYIENGDTLRYIVGLQFLFESNRQKDKLVAQIFKMQRERRKLG